jgi:hypothetical protein
MLASTPMNDREIIGGQRIVTDEFTRDPWADRTARRSGSRSVAVGASFILPEVSAPADQPIRARESISVLRLIAKPQLQDRNS